MRTSKDKYEHRLVVDDIRQRLPPLCATLGVPCGPLLRSTGILWLLSTCICGELWTLS